MATPDMTHASGAQDQTEARKPGVRGWFQPPAADARGSETDSGAVPDRIGEPGEAAGQKSGAEVGDAEDEAGDARDPRPPRKTPPPDLPRPRLIRDDPGFDRAGWRGGGGWRQPAAGSGAAAPARADGTSPADGDAAPADAGDPPSGKAAKRSR